MKDKSPIEDFIFDFIDKCKPLFFPEQWNNTFLDYSKNEIFALLFVYRRDYANMSEIAEYIGVPLNTATGIIDRLEKRGVLCRERDPVDKRVVTVTITRDGMEFLTTELKGIGNYYSMLMESISDEEKILLLKLISKILDILSQNLSNKSSSKELDKKVRKIVIE
jgi:DNA-binding MarR family transcriptional regulator